MAGQSGQRSDPLITDLVSEPRRFSFFQAIRILRDYVSSSGSGARPETGAVQIRPNSSLACPTSDIYDIEFLPPVDVDDETERLRVTVNFLGLYGVDAPLPDFYLEDIAQNEEEDNPRRAFLDVFHQRIYWLLYRAWCKYRHQIQYETDSTDDYTQRMFSLIGLADPALRGRLGIRADRLLPFSAVLSRSVCSASSLEALLTTALGVPVRVEEFVARWAQIAHDQRMRLGENHASLGQDTTLGERVCDVGGKFRVHVGPLEWADYVKFQPGGQARRALRALIDASVSRPLDFDIRLQLFPSPRRRLTLGQQSSCGLGHTSWLAAPEQDVTQANFHGDQH